jgi:5-methylcytosine-specific restriction endonuclease McrA
VSTRAKRNGPLSGDCDGCHRFVSALDVDHVTPLWAGGLHTRKNLQYLCSDCHRRKTAKELRSGSFRDYRRERANERARSLRWQRRKRRALGVFILVIAAIGYLLAAYVYGGVIF